MPANKKPRKKYRPLHQPGKAVDTLSMVLSGLERPTEADRTAIGVGNYSSLQLVLDGKAERIDWETVCQALNVTGILAEWGLGRDHADDILAAKLAWADVGKRWIRWGKFQITPAEEEAVRFGLAIHDEQLKATNVKQMELAVREEAKRKRDPNKVMKAFKREVA